MNKGGDSSHGLIVWNFDWSLITMSRVEKCDFASCGRFDSCIMLIVETLNDLLNVYIYDSTHPILLAITCVYMYYVFKQKWPVTDTVVFLISNGSLPTWVNRYEKRTFDVEVPLTDVVLWLFPIMAVFSSIFILGTTFAWNTIE